MKLVDDSYRQKIEILRKDFPNGVIYAPGVLLVPVDKLGLFAIIYACLDMDIDFTKISSRGEIPINENEYKLDNGAVMVNQNMHQFVLDFIIKFENDIINEYKNHKEYKEIMLPTDRGNKFIMKAIQKVK